jgi:hypothetical protein
MRNDGSAVLASSEFATVGYLLKANGFPGCLAVLKSGAASKDIVIVK